MYLGYGHHFMRQLAQARMCGDDFKLMTHAKQSAPGKEWEPHF